MLLLVAGTLAAAGLGADPAAMAAGPKPRHCGTIPVHDEFHPRVRVSAMHTSCAKARRIMRAYLDGPADEQELVGPDDYNGYVRLKRFPGWHCTSGAGAGGCRKGRREAGWDWFFARGAPARSRSTVLRAFYSVSVPSGGHVSRPATIVFGADGRTSLDEMAWRRWGGRSAVARGAFEQDSGPAGEPDVTSKRALIVASEPARCDGWSTYLKLKVRVHQGDGRTTIWEPISLASSWRHCRRIGR